MLTRTLPRLEKVFADNPAMLSMVKRKTHISSTAELLLFTPQMIGTMPGLGGSPLMAIQLYLTPFELELRSPDVSLKDTVTHLFGSVANAPIEVLNFESDGKKAKLKPLTIMKKIVVGTYVVRDIDEVVRGLRPLRHNVDDLNMMSQLNTRLQDWDLRTFDR